MKIQSSKKFNFPDSVSNVEISKIVSKYTKNVEFIINIIDFRPSDSFAKHFKRGYEIWYKRYVSISFA